MNAAGKTTGDTSGTSSLDLRQLIKVVVYSLLLINWGLYFAEDWEIARHTLRNGGSFLDWTTAFAVSIDELAWFVLLFLFELETYVLSDESFTRARTAALHGTRWLCYVFLAHTLYAYAVTVNDLEAVVPAEAGSLCQLADSDVSFAYNLEYTELSRDNCGSLSTESEFYFIDEELVVTDTSGLVIEKQLAWIDLAEASVWLAILFFIEVMVRLQEKGITRGLALRTAFLTKLALYGLLWCAAGYWIYRGHWMYAWDEALWILGFAAIEMNISEWKQEIIEAEANA